MDLYRDQICGKLKYKLIDIRYPLLQTETFLSDYVKI